MARKSSSEKLALNLIMLGLRLSFELVSALCKRPSLPRSPKHRSDLRGTVSVRPEDRAVVGASKTDGSAEVSRSIGNQPGFMLPESEIRISTVSLDLESPHQSESSPSPIAKLIPWVILGLFAICLFLLRPSKVGFPEIFLGVGLCVAGVIMVFLYLEHLKSIDVRRAEQKARREEFENHIVQLLKVPPQGDCAMMGNLGK